MSSKCTSDGLDEIISTFYNPDPLLSIRDKAKLIEGILANVKPETQDLLSHFMYRIDNGEKIDDAEWQSISDLVSTDLAQVANQRERTLSGRAQGDLLEVPFVHSFVRQANEAGYIQVKIVPNTGNRAGFDIYCINPETREAVIVELKNWSKTTTLHMDNVGDNYLEKRLVRIIDGMEVKVVCEILVMFGGYIASTVQERFSSDGVYVIHEDEKIKPDYSLNEDQKAVQCQRIENAAKYALEIVEKILKLKQASGLDLSGTIYKIMLDGKIVKGKAIQSPTFNDEYITQPEESGEIQTVDPSRCIIIVPDNPVFPSNFAVIILKTLLSRPPD